MLKQYVEPYETISIIGISKNAGKTTVLNKIIEEYKGKAIGITSIGLDGEKTDNITNKPKPRIKVYPKMLVATASECLNEATCNYVVHEKTNVRTQLGNIMIVEVITPGLMLVAGPSTNHEMVEVTHRLRRYNIKKVFIDGALFRKSIASFRVADACILATGASFDDDMNKVVLETKKTVDQLNLEVVVPMHKIKIIKYHKHMTITVQGRIRVIKNENLLGNEECIEEYLNPKVRVLYINGALTNKLVNHIVNKWNVIEDLTVVVNDPSHILLNKASIHRLEMMKVKIKVLNKTNLLFVTYNPVSPNGTVFDNEEFGRELSQTIEMPIFNVVNNME